MLSRVANSLYWMARYLERADNIARIVDVDTQLLLDLGRTDESEQAAHWLPVIQATGDDALFLELHPRPSARDATGFLVLHPGNPNSIHSSICLARENARTVRDQITAEYWEEINRLYWFVVTPQAHRQWQQSPSEFLQQIRTGVLHLIGLTHATLIRQEGWWFTQTGKFLERADKTSRILDVRFPTLPERGAPAAVSQAEALGWAAVLRGCSAWDAYKSIHGADIDPRLVAEFLMLNEDFPRSVRFCVAGLNRSLRRISGVPEGRFCNEAEKQAGRLAAELQFSTVADLFEPGLHDYIDRLQGRLNQIGQSLFDTYMFQPLPSLEDEILAQQQQQQQQAIRPPQTPPPPPRPG